MTTPLLSTAELQALDAAHHVHPFTDTGALNSKGSRIITRAEGVYVYDSDGNRILDGMAGLWCVGIGYGREEVVEAVAAQMRELPYYNTFFQTSHPPALALAAELTRITPAHINHVFFTGSGSEANDTVVRMVRHYWALQGQPERQIIIARKNAYHGSTMAGASLGGMSALHAQGGLPIPGIHHINQPYWYGEGGDTDPAAFGLARARELEQAIQTLGADKVAAFIGEPVQGAGGVVIPPGSYWPEIQRICDEYGILLVADEVITGFGRTGAWFGADYYGITPDLMPIAKGLSSGYLPIGGVLVGDRVFDALADGGEFFHGFTYSGHPATCAAALKVLEILQREQLPARVKNHIGPYLQRRWRELGEHPLIGEARMVGLMGALELTPDKAGRAPFKVPKGTVGLLCRENSFSNHLIMRHVGDTMIIAPPLVITDAEVDELIEKARLTLDQTYTQVKQLGYC
ncbi:MAG: aspartate aminotransferase family protein [Thiothrix sp.]|nr:aspartate aminotransferase family protein [Thiothrix sp.]HPQ96218.1 aspartate aminotransferase family protein [Thiolinea sp.]